MRLIGVLLLAVCISIAAFAAPNDRQPVTVKSGPWEATFGPSGIALTHEGIAVSSGSYLNVYTPGYKGTVLGSAQAWRQGKAETSADGRAATLSADLPGGHLTYCVELDQDAARFSLRFSLVEGAQVGPVEYAILQIPEARVSGAIVEVWDAAGQATTRAPLPVEFHQGELAPSGQGVTLKTPTRCISVEALGAVAVYPYDARHERYGAQRGIWAFSTASARAGSETVAAYEVRILPPEPARKPGRITFAPDTPAIAILTRADPSKRETLAANELAGILEEMTGQRLERSQMGKAAPAGAILVGPAAVDGGLISRQELDAVAPDGYVVRVSGGRAGVSGWRDVGTVYGAYALLRHLGCRFYAPNCEMIPHTEVLTIPECSLSEKPFFEFRNLAGNLKLGNTPADDLMNPREIGEPGNIVHSSDYLLSFDKYHEQHPEYFALQKDGQRLHRNPNAQRFDVHLCLSNPEVRRISAERMLALIEKQSDRTFFGVSQGDGFAWCQCAQCKALDGKPGEMTDRLLDYVNFIARDVARKYPQKRILTLAYTSATSPPPLHVLPEPNVMVQYCPYPPRTGCSSHDLTCQKNTLSRQDLLGWLEKCPKNMYIFDYPTGYQNYYEPFGSFYAMERKLRFYAEHGIRGLFYCGTPMNFHDLFVYVQSRLLWQPDTAVEPMIDEFMAAYYGPASSQMRGFFDFMHREVDQRPIHQMCEGPSPQFVTAAYAETAMKFLDQAEAAAASDRVALYRVRSEKLCVLFGFLNAHNPFNGRLDVPEEVFASRLGEFARIGRTMRISSFVRQQSTEKWLQQIARLRIPSSPWYQDPLVERLIADPAGTMAAQRPGPDR